MTTMELVIGGAILLVSLIITIICLMQEQKPQNATSALTGATNDSFYDKNRGRTKEARLKKITTVLTVLFFIMILFMDIVMPLINK
ncbi:MAG: preprotein translocase subunit SecG [Oscillospiraceae bacterium]|nr:preprotein translocase subunit SecG [Oscillospiraceae bacterium]